MSLPVTIYALADADSIFYVGKTNNLQSRIEVHRKRFKGVKFDVQILRSARPSKAGKIEGQIIRALSKRGQCRENYQHSVNAGCRRFIREQGSTVGVSSDILKRYKEACKKRGMIMLHETNRLLALRAAQLERRK